MKLYNTLTRKVEEFKPQHPPVVTLYTCGPTVYDYPHIGNWFTFIRYDILVRALIAAGYEPNWVMNITDVGHLVSDADEGEDKLEKGARREGKSAWDIAKHYSDYFVEGMQRLNMLTPQQLPKATDHIQEQIDLVTQLEKKGFTYVINDGVYYDTAKFPTYADFAHLDLAHLKEGTRVVTNPEKRNPTDFALWKFSPKDNQRDMEWDSPWGKGFPGWHLECSAMSIKYLGETLDIHAGGIDHIPVHHTNEIAQSEAATGQKFANYWVHMNHIMVNDEKIAKSSGNGITLEDVEAKGFTLEAFRLLVLQSHYRTQAEFSWDNLSAAQNRLKSWQALADLRWQAVDNTDTNRDAKTSMAYIQEKLSDDLNTSEAIVAIDRQASLVLPVTVAERDTFITFLESIDNSLGLQLSARQDITNEQKTMINERDEARRSQDFTKSDTLRTQLEEQGIGLSDTDRGAIWFRL